MRAGGHTFPRLGELSGSLSSLCHKHTRPALTPRTWSSVPALLPRASIPPLPDTPGLSRAASHALGICVHSFNNPINYTDPSGHCNGDPSNNNPFDKSGETIAYLDCTLENFDAMSIADRLLWIQYFMDQFHIGLWFNNIEGIIQGFVENGLAGSGSWLSVVDAAILQGIQDGFVASDMEEAKDVVDDATSENPGAALWKLFFDELAKDPAKRDYDALVEMWGAAEAASTQHGEVIAGDLGLTSDPYETFFLKTGNAYRWAAFHGGLGIWAAAAALTVDANPFIAYRVGEWFNDPRSTVPILGRSPVYWYSSAIWKVQP